MSNWFITGGSRGLGRAFAEAALDRGDRVAATSRRAGSLSALGERYGDDFLPLEVDITDEADVRRAFSETVNRFGQVDVVVNNAGYVHVGAVEETTEAEARAVVDAMFFGVFFVTKAAISHMRERGGGGTIVQVSSLAAVGGLPGNSMYAAVKWAVEGFTEAARQEVAGWGIRMICVAPAQFRTDIASSVSESEPMEEYEDILGPQRSRFRDGGSLTHAPGDPGKAAAALLDLVDLEHPPKRLLMGESAYERSVQLWSERIAEASAWESVSKSLSFDGE